MKPIIYILFITIVTIIYFGIDYFKNKNNLIDKNLTDIKDLQVKIDKINEDKIKIDKMLEDKLILLKQEIYQNILNTNKLTEQRLFSIGNQVNTNKIQTDQRLIEQNNSLRTELRNAINTSKEENNKLLIQIKDLQEKINAIKLNSSIAPTNTSIIDLETKINNQIKLINESIARLDNTNSQIINTINSTTDSKIDEIQKQIDSLKNSFDSELLDRTITQVESLVNQISTNTTNITELNNKLNNIPTTLDPENLRKLQTLVEEVKVIENNYSSINNFLTDIDLFIKEFKDQYVSRTLISDYAKLDELNKYTLITDLSSLNISSVYALKTELPDMDPYALISNVPSKQDISNLKIDETYALISNVPSKLDLSNLKIDDTYAKVGQLPNLNDYALKNDVPSRLDISNLKIDDTYARKNAGSTNNVICTGTPPGVPTNICVNPNIYTSFVFPNIKIIDIVALYNSDLYIKNILFFDDQGLISNTNFTFDLGSHNLSTSIFTTLPNTGVILTERNSLPNIFNISNNIQFYFSKVNNGNKAIRITFNKPVNIFKLIIDIGSASQISMAYRMIENGKSESTSWISNLTLTSSTSFATATPVIMWDTTRFILKKFYNMPY